jgi:methylenetetrahydrofolate dehydrogenase (NADP+)/methenyltetrahydrofolate cyclohydrolase
MQTRIIDGAALAARLRETLAGEVATLAREGLAPGLAVVIVGDHAASQVYVRNKIRACADAGIRSTHVALPADTSEAALLDHVRRLNEDPAVHGILVQLPLPRHVAPDRILHSIAPDKDVDGFHPVNAGLLATGHPRLVPCTPAGVMALLEAAGMSAWARHAVVVGASNIVGKPAAYLLLQQGATVTMCNSKTPDLAAHTRQADIVVAAVGRPRMLTGAMIRPGAVVIDVGINRLADGKLAGDCDLESMLGIAAAVTPVPGGVGPMTIAMLLANTVKAAALQAAHNPALPAAHNP